MRIELLQWAYLLNFTLLMMHETDNYPQNAIYSIIVRT